MSDPPPLSAPRPTSLAGIGADTAAALVKGVIGTPAILMIVLLNVVMVSGWVWLFVQVSKARTAEMHDIIAIVDDCVKTKLR